MRASRSRLLSFLGLLTLAAATACAPPAQRANTDSQPAASVPQRQTTLRIATRFEIVTPAFKFDEPGGGGSGNAKRPFNAGLTLIDSQTQPRPSLAEQLPQLNTASWQVFPDGRMETTYRLRPNITWHDGAPMTADDFIFAWRVYRAPSLPFTAKPQDLMDEVTAPDPRTLVIRWKSLFNEAGALTSAQFDPLPAHILRDAFQPLEQDTSLAESFMNLPFWSFQYVGAGPFRMERREPGAFIEGLAFPGHVLGRPKIDRILVRAIGDENTVLSNLLAGELDYTPTLALRFEHSAVLKQDWVPSGKGKYVIGPDFFIINMHQFRQDVQQEPALFDVRVRRAMVHSVDRQALADTLFDGEVPPPDTLAYRSTPYFAELDRAITKYPYDPRRTEQVMTEAGFRRGADSFFIATDGRRFQPDYNVRQSTQFERGQSIMVDSWRRAGLDVQTSVLPNVTVPEMVRHTFPSIVGRTMSVEDFHLFASSEIGLESNRWRGQNRSGWANAEYDRLYEQFRNTIDRKEADRLAVQILKLASEEVPFYVVYESPALMAHVTGLRGPDFPAPGPPVTTPVWNIHEWEMVG